MLKKGHGHQGPHMVMPSGQTHKSHFAIDFTRKSNVLSLKYLHENTTRYEELGACWTIHDEAELKNALLSLRNNKKNVPYTEENVTKFLSEIIYGGHSERDVLGDYEDFIVNHARN
jgi:hypothetical protein